MILFACAIENDFVCLFVVFENHFICVFKNDFGCLFVVFVLWSLPVGAIGCHANVGCAKTSNELI